MIAVVSVDQAYGIGKGGQLLKSVRTDLRHFRELTLNKVLIYGRKTLDTYPNKKVLPKRVNIILSRRLKDDEIENAIIVRNHEQLDEVLDGLRQEGYSEEDFVVVGGASVYADLLPRISRIYITRFDALYGADAFFPDLQIAGFKRIDCDDWLEEEGVRFRYETWQR